MISRVTLFDLHRIFIGEFFVAHVGLNSTRARQPIPMVDMNASGVRLADRVLCSSRLRMLAPRRFAHFVVHQPTSSAARHELQLHVITQDFGCCPLCPLPAQRIRGLSCPKDRGGVQRVCFFVQASIRDLLKLVRLDNDLDKHINIKQLSCVRSVVHCAIRGTEWTTAPRSARGDASIRVRLDIGVGPTCVRREEVFVAPVM